MIDVCFSPDTSVLMHLLSCEIDVRETYYLPDFLSVGDISLVDPRARKAEVISMMGDGAISDEFDDLYAQFQGGVTNGQNVRAWVTSDDHEMVGLRYLAGILSDGAELHVVHVPKPGELGSFEEMIDTAIENSARSEPASVRGLRTEWQRLVEENSPLRVVDDGLVVSADVDYFDQMIVESGRALGSSATASAVAMDVNLRRAATGGSQFCFYFLLKRTMAVLPDLKI